MSHSTPALDGLNSLGRRRPSVPPSDPPSRPTDEVSAVAQYATPVWFARLELHHDERVELRDLASDVRARLTDAIAIATKLPPRVRRFLAQVQEKEIAVAVISGLPLDPHLPATPTCAQSAEVAGPDEDILHLLCASQLGEVFGWAGQKTGRIVHDVCPSSRANARRPELHTEDVFSPVRADYVSLFCLRNPDAVPTMVSRVDALLGERTLAEGLAQKRFRFYANDAHLPVPDLDSTFRDRPWSVGPVLFGPPWRRYLRFDRGLMSAADPGDVEAERLIERAEAQLTASIEPIILSPGDMVFLDNDQVVHGRTSFAPRADGRAGWLKRINVRGAHPHRRSNH